MKKLLKFPFRIFVIATLLLFLAGCATYYMKQQKIYDAMGHGDWEAASKLLDAQKSSKPDNKDHLLYLFDKGWLEWAREQSKESNRFLQQADDYMDVSHVTAGQKALAVISNPMMKAYTPEDHERIFVNYYKALNYVDMNDLEGALVEARRINEKIYAQNDKLKEKKNKYSDDAFAHVMMGIIYEASRDYNNAFIAYKNALKVYDEIYTPLFGYSAPAQLKRDILRTAYKTGFYDDVRFYEKQFSMEYDRSAPTGNTGDLVFIWHNGLGPVKDEWSINFTNAGASNGFVTFANPELGMSFPIYLGGGGKSASYNDVHVVRVAFPKYIERMPIYNNAELFATDQHFPFEMGQNVQKIAVQALKDRMLREMGETIARLAAKQAMEYAARESKQEGLGATVSIINALTEKADTRNWQTLPHDIRYVRMTLPEGTQKVQMRLYAGQGRYVDKEFQFEIQKNRSTIFHFTTMESYGVKR